MASQWTFRVLMGMTEMLPQTSPHALAVWFRNADMKVSLGQVRSTLLQLSGLDPKPVEKHANGTFSLTPFGNTLAEDLKTHMGLTWAEDSFKQTYLSDVVGAILKATSVPLDIPTLARDTLLSPSSVRKGLAKLKKDEKVKWEAGENDEGNPCEVFTWAEGESQPDLPGLDDDDLNFGGGSADEDIDVDALVSSSTTTPGPAPAAGTVMVPPITTSATVTTPPVPLGGLDQVGDEIDRLVAEVEAKESTPSAPDPQPTPKPEVKGNGHDEGYVRIPLKVWEMASLQAAIAGQGVGEYVENIIRQRHDFIKRKIAVPL